MAQTKIRLGLGLQGVQGCEIISVCEFAGQVERFESAPECRREGFLHRMQAQGLKGLY